MMVLISVEAYLENENENQAAAQTRKSKLELAMTKLEMTASNNSVSRQLIIAMEF